MSQELVISLLKEFGQVQSVIIDTEGSGRKALVKFIYKDSALKALKQVQSDDNFGFSLKHADSSTIKKYESLES